MRERDREPEGENAEESLYLADNIAGAVFMGELKT